MAGTAGSAHLATLASQPWPTTPAPPAPTVCFAALSSAKDAWLSALCILREPNHSKPDPPHRQENRTTESVQWPTKPPSQPTNHSSRLGVGTDHSFHVRQSRNRRAGIRAENRDRKLTNQARPKKWHPDRVQKKRGPKTGPRFWASFLSQQGEARQYGFTPVRQKSCPENGHQKIAVFSSKHSQKKNASNPRLRAQALSANRQTAFSTRKTYRREPDVKWKAPEPQQHTEPYKQNHELKNQ